MSRIYEGLIFIYDWVIKIKEERFFVKGDVEDKFLNRWLIKLESGMWGRDKNLDNCCCLEMVNVYFLKLRYRIKRKEDVEEVIIVIIFFLFINYF